MMLNVFTNDYMVQLIFDIALSLAAQMQWYCRATVRKELAQGPYTVIVSDEAQTRTLHVTGQAL